MGEFRPIGSHSTQIFLMYIHMKQQVEGKKEKDANSYSCDINVLRWVYKQAFTNITSLRVAKKFLRFQVNACIDFTKGKNKLKNYCTELMGLYTWREG